MSSGSKQNTQVKTSDGQPILVGATGFYIGRKGRIVPALEFLKNQTPETVKALKTWVEQRSPKDGHLRKIYAALDEYDKS